MIPDPGNASEFVDVGSTMQVPRSGARFVTVGRHEVMLARDARGDIVAFSGQCTHAFARLSGGTVEGGQVTCPAHGARFDIATGRSQSNCPNLPAIEVKVEGRRVLVRPPAGG